MRGTIVDFLNFAAVKPELGKELAELAARHDFEFTEELSDADLDQVAGGMIVDTLDFMAPGSGRAPDLPDPTLPSGPKLVP